MLLHWRYISILAKLTQRDLYGAITNDVSDYINLLVRIAHIICNYLIFYIMCQFMYDEAFLRKKT